MTSPTANKPEQDDWMPPTPRSQLVPLPPPTLPVDHLVLLPPPLLPHDSHGSYHSAPGLSRRSSLSLHSLLNSSAGSSSSSVAAGPLSSLAPSEDSAKYKQEQQDALLAASLADADESTTAKRPRRSAAIVAARNIPRHPSPFELDDGAAAVDDGEADPDVDEDSLSPAPAGSSRTRGGGGGGGQSKRKVSHSLIERRRREKINECLNTLRETVPQLREEGEKKLAKARERGRKRGRGDEAGERGGLHKLEILQGTISYIDDLRARIAALEASSSASSSAHAPLPSPDSASASPPLLRSLPSPLLRASISSSLALHTGGCSEPTLPAQDLGPDDHEAGMLLLDFATSPELRPVQM
ncbi:hypothetical protein JCM10213_002237 [Rhodosporidiobolus nylandii]